MKSLAALIAVVPLLAACGASEVATPDRKNDSAALARQSSVKPRRDDSCPSSLTRHRVASAGFSIGVPAGWGIYDRQTPATDEEIALVRSEDPAFAAYLELMRKPDSPFVLFAMRCVTERGYATNMNVLSFPAGDDGFEEIARGAQEGVEDLGADPEVAQVTLPAGKAMRLSYIKKFPLGSGQVTTAITQYVLRAGDRAYILTYGTLWELEDDWEDVFTASARSFRADS